MADKNNELNKEIDTSNIFDEFTQDSSLINEIDEIKKERNRDLFFYLSKFGYVMQTFFWIGFVFLLILFSYIYIQNNENIKNSNILDPFCPIILGKVHNNDSFCSSISSIKKIYWEQLSNIEDTQIDNIFKILERLYEVENFTKTKEVLFLSDKSNNKLKVLSILEEFDDMKNEFDKIDKQKIQCNSFNIDSNKKVFSMKCVAYSAWFEKWLRWFDWTTEESLKWSSLSIANSFLNYIDKQSDIFTITDRQKVFRSEAILWEKSDFTSKTIFDLKLTYNLQ